MLRGFPSGCKTNVARDSRGGWNKIVRDSRGNLAPFDFHGADAATKICSQSLRFHRRELYCYQLIDNYSLN